MNVRIDTTTPAAPARPIDFDDLYGAICELMHTLHFLTEDLEEAFRDDRGKPAGAHCMSFTFATSGIDARLWLAADAWRRASDLRETLLTLESQFDGEDAA